MKSAERFFKKIMLGISGFSSRRPGPTFAVLAFVCGLSVISIAMSPLKSDVTRLIPAHAEKTSLYLRLMDDFGGMEKMFVIFTSEAIHEKFADIDRVGASLEATGLFKDVEWKVTPEMKSFLSDSMKRRMVLYFDEDGMKEFITRLAPDGMEGALGKTAMRMSLPSGRLAQYDPLAFSELLEGRMGLGQFKFDFQSGYYLTPDGSSVVMMASPKVSPRDIKATSALINAVEAALKSNAPDGLEYTVTGNHAITLHEASIMKRDIIQNFLSSFALVMLVFVIFLRSARGFLVSLSPVLLSILISTGLMCQFTGSISEASGGFAGLLIGLGADLGIVLYIRHIYFSASGFERPDSIQESVSAAGPGITLGVLTTAATFLPMAFSSFSGLREIGLLTGIGILVTWVLVFALSPHLSGGKPARLAGAGIVEKAFSFSFASPLPVIAISVLTIAFIGYFAKDLQTETEIRKLGSRHNPARDAIEGLSGKYLDERPFLIKGRASSNDEASVKSEDLKKRLAGRLEKTIGPSDMLPPISRQSANLEAVKRLDREKIIRDFKAASAKAGFSDEFAKTYSKTLAEILTPDGPIGPEDLGPLRAMYERLIRETNGSYEFIVSGAIKDGSAPDIPAEYEHTSPALARDEVYKLLTNDAVKLTAIGIALVNIVMLIGFRSPKSVMLAQVPVAASAIVTVGFMGLFGISLNFMNAIVFVMLFGIGTDYGIHLIHRFETDGIAEATGRETGSAVLLSGLTTIAGFGSMAWSSYIGLSSMGLVTAIGVFWCMIFSLTLLPAIMGVSKN